MQTPIELSEVDEVVSEQTLESLVYELAVKVDELVAITEKQNDMLQLIVEQVEPTLEALKSSPLGMFLGSGQ